ncbi:MAG: hypothetical protein L6302_01030 [Desulfobacteraceae bacterium]|nr:hypothetical protein [Desulfobacteraceae bacterium]
MEKNLKIIFFIALGVSYLAGYFIHKHHAVFFYHHIPSIESYFGIIFTVFLIFMKMTIAFFAEREEDFYE